MSLIVLTLIISFLTTYFLTPGFAKFFEQISVRTRDVHKRSKSLLPSSGGVCVISGIITGLFFYIAVKTFIYKETTGFIELFSAITSIFIITLSGFFDDLNSKLHEYEGFKYKKGLKQWQKPLFTIPAVIPLMVINAGTTTMSVPFFGVVDFGLLYPLLIVPVAIVGCSNMVNLLGGFNGLESSLGVIYTFSLGLYALFLNQLIPAVILLSTTVALISFLNYNFVPARILPGDSLTYALGAIVAVCSVLANMEKFALMTMSLFLVEGLLKFKSLFELGKFATSLGELDLRSGKLKPKYDKVYSLTHFAMGRKGSSERVIIAKLVALQMLVSVSAWLFV